jgi:hypothetical protein
MERGHLAHHLSAATRSAPGPESVRAHDCQTWEAAHHGESDVMTQSKRKDRSMAGKQIKGVNGQITIEGDWLTIERKDDM